MVVINGRFDGSKIIFDEPVPDTIPANTLVRVIFNESALGNDEGTSLAKLVELSKPAGLPADFAEQHEHYVKGTRRR